jgi:hypothetical protein
MYTLVATNKNLMQNLKIEVNRQKWPLTYDLLEYKGISIPVMSKGKMFAHKLSAITDRKEIQNRDLYDAYFMFEKSFPIDDRIIKLRTNLSTAKYLEKISKLIGNKKVRKNILDGLGNTLPSKKRKWAKENLIDALKIKLLAY